MKSLFRQQNGGGQENNASREAARRRGGGGVTARAVLLGLLLIPLNCYVIVRLEKVLWGPYVSTISLFPNTITFLFVLVGVNAMLRRLWPRRALNAGEMLTIYTMLGISTGLAGLDGAIIIQELMPYAAWFSGPPHNFAPLLPLFPSWLVVKDRAALAGYFNGASRFYEPSHLAAWAAPMLAWTAFFAVLFWTLMCVNVIFRAQWQDRERLSFPLVWLPLEMTAPESHAPGGLWRSPMLWLGFALAASVTLLNGVAFLYPSFRAIPTGPQDLKPFFTVKPWTGIDWLPLTFYPFVIGLGYLLPLDLLFSCWFGFLWFKAQMVVGNAQAWDTVPGFPLAKEQGLGMVFCLAGYYLWTARRHLADVWRSAWGPRGETGKEEAVSYRVAARGALAGLAGLVAFLVAGGATWWVALLALVFFLPIAFVVARIRAEFGPPVHDFHFIGPDEMLPRLMGTTSFHPGDLAMLTCLFTINRAHRGDVMPVGLEGLAMAHRRDYSAARLFWACIAAAAVSVLATFWAYDHQAYALGVGSKFASHGGFGEQALQRLSEWTSQGRDASGNAPARWAVGIGFVTAAILLLLRARFFGFALHPIGFAVASSWSIHLIWMPLFLAWLVKLLVTRYGGLALYRRFLPFFYGAILGDCVAGTFWAILSVLFDTQTYSFFGQ